MNKVLTLGTIRDYILKYFPDLLWWDGINKHQVWNESYNFKHRAGMPNEIRIEFDSEDKEKNWESINFTAVNLYNLGYSFAIFYVEGGRSPHIHIYDLDELEILNYEQRIEYRTKFINKICPKGNDPDYGLCDEKHLCALEFVNHFKYNKPKELLCFFGKGGNGYQASLDNRIKLEILNKEKKEKKEIHKKQLKLGDLIVTHRRDLIIKSLTFEKVFEKYGIDYKGKMALCPFHTDKDKSLSFSNDKGLWKCFGCNAKGDIITLIKRLKERENDKFN